MSIIKKKIIVDENIKINFFTNIFSSFFFTGYFPTASGTIGSLASLSIFFFKIFYNPIVLFSLIIIVFFLGVYSSGVMVKRFGDDPSVIVIDEAVGMWITILIFIIFAGAELNLMYIGICFLSFRFFDITKLQPAKYFDTLKTGFGIMMDDVIAGIYGGAIACIIFFIIK